jgi:hypothetical protein
MSAICIQIDVAPHEFLFFGNSLLVSYPADIEHRPALPAIERQGSWSISRAKRFLISGTFVLDLFSLARNDRRHPGSMRASSGGLKAREMEPGAAPAGKGQSPCTRAASEHPPVGTMTHV